jgi:soluble lytic murein transglycosylase-like protein
MDRDRIEGILSKGLDMWARNTGLEQVKPEPPPQQGSPFAEQFLKQTAVTGHKDKVSQYAKQYGVPEDVALGVVEMESKGNPGYQGPDTKHGAASGLMGLMPHMFLPGENPMDPDTNLNVGMRALAHHYARTGDWDKAAARLAYGDNLNTKDASGTDGWTYAKKLNQARSAYANPYPFGG